MPSYHVEHVTLYYFYTFVHTTHGRWKRQPTHAQRLPLLILFHPSFFMSVAWKGTPPRAMRLIHLSFCTLVPSRTNSIFPCSFDDSSSLSSGVSDPWNEIYGHHLKVIELLKSSH